MGKVMSIIMCCKITQVLSLELSMHNRHNLVKFLTYVCTLHLYILLLAMYVNCETVAMYRHAIQYLNHYLIQCYHATAVFILQQKIIV